MRSYDFEGDIKRFKALAEEAYDRFDESGLYKDLEDREYYLGLVKKLEDLQWHYSCLESEGVLEG